MTAGNTMPGLTADPVPRAAGHTAASTAAAIARGLSGPQRSAIASLPSRLGHLLVGWRSGCPAAEENDLRNLGLIQEHWTWASTTRPDTGLTELGLAVSQAIPRDPGGWVPAGMTDAALAREPAVRAVQAVYAVIDHEAARVDPRSQGAQALNRVRAALEKAAPAISPLAAPAGGWRPMSEQPAPDTEGDVWNDHGDGLAGRIADCLFDGVRWLYQPYPFGDWEPVTNPQAWMLKPAPPASGRGSRSDPAHPGAAAPDAGRAET